MNWHAVKAIYQFEMARTFRTLVEMLGKVHTNKHIYDALV